MVLLVHEAGHYSAAKMQNMLVEGFGLRLKPFPHAYVAVVDKNISIQQRIIFLLSGNLFVIIAFIITSALRIQYPPLYYIIALQIIVDTNPFYSDYVVATISYMYYARIKRNRAIGTAADIDVHDLRNEYLFSPTWHIHLIAWGAIIIMLLSPKLLNYTIQ
ncbi:MAG: site-2 protease family protein [Bacteroidales bacterium]|nr:site-2 protease family protein [Bacteroidales bacterium]